MKEIQPRKRSVPPFRDQVIAFMRSALPPLIVRYAVPFVRSLVATPVFRTVAVRIAGVGFLFLLFPAIIAGLLAWLITGNSTAASMSALTVFGLVALVIIALIAKLYNQWKRFRLRFMR